MWSKIPKPKKPWIAWPILIIALSFSVPSIVLGWTCLFMGADANMGFRAFFGIAISALIWLGFAAIQDLSK